MRALLDNYLTPIVRLLVGDTVSRAHWRAMRSRVGMVATFAPAVAGMEAEFEDDGPGVGPWSAQPSEHNRRVADAALRLGEVDAVMLAHFSTARALATLQQRVNVPVLAAPEAAVVRLRGMVEP